MGAEKRSSRSRNNGNCWLGCFGSPVQDAVVDDVEEESNSKHKHKPNPNPNLKEGQGTTTTNTDESTSDMMMNSSNTNVVKRYSWAEIEKMTCNFSEVIGVGGFSTVYLGRLGSILVAVKVYTNYSERLNQVFRSELQICTELHHPNIVKLLGYCDERDEGVLVFEYIPNGTLQDLLHKKTTKDDVNDEHVMLSWENRMAIAYELAESLDHLHEQCSPHIVHGDIKASNILLLHRNTPINNINCSKLCDFGFAKKGFSSTVSSNSYSNSNSSSSSRSSSRIAMMGSPGYVDPHYLMTGIGSKKTDIYSYGVILLELITGLDAYCSQKEQLLTSLVIKKSTATMTTSSASAGGRGERYFDVKKVVEMLDPRLLTVQGGQALVNPDEVKAMACIAAMCLHHLPSLRPSAAEICKGIRENISSIMLHYSTNSSTK